MLKRHLINAALILIFLSAYIFVSRELHPIMGDTFYFLSLCPILLVGWSYGSAAGMLAGGLTYLLNLSVGLAIKDPLFPVSSFTVFGTATLILLGGLFGYVSELLSQVRRKNIEIGRLAQIVDYSDDAIFSKDLDGKIMTWNDGAHSIYGYSAAEMIGRVVDRLLPPDRPNEVKDILKRIKKGERVEHYETLRLTKDGRTIDMSLTVSPIKGESGRIIGASTIGRDISKAKQMDKVKDEFLSIMAHDLKSPLIAVLGYSDMMIGGLGGQLTEKQRSFVEVIRRQGEQLQSMIDSLLDYTRAEFGKLVLNLENINLDNLVVESIKAFTPEAAQSKITLDFAPPADQITVAADKNMINQVINNLLANALKYTPEGGKVAISLNRKGSEAVFAVSDNGRGIAPDKIGRIFDKFFMVEGKTAREKRSLGLGLYIAKKFIEAHHGRISAESAGEGKGTTFSFTLPL
jgi:PAS domain S-box-containing protein